jgi:hypothetical protein
MVHLRECARRLPGVRTTMIHSAFRALCASRCALIGLGDQKNCPLIDQHAHIAMYAMLRGDFVKRLDRNRLLSQVLSSDSMSQIAECHSLPRDHAQEGDNHWAEIKSGKVTYRIVGVPEGDFSNVPDHCEASYATLESAMLRSRGSRTAARRGDNLGCRHRGQSCITRYPAKFKLPRCGARHRSEIETEKGTVTVDSTGSMGSSARGMSGKFVRR